MWGNLVVENDNSFALRFINYNNEIMNFCVNSEVENCTKLEKNHEYVDLANRLSLNEIKKVDYYGERIEVELLYKGKNIFCYNENYEIYEKKKELIGILSNYNNLGFIHETSIENIYNIYKYGGIYSRNYLLNNNILFNDIAEHGVLERTNKNVMNYARFYLRPKTPAHYGFHTNNVETCIFICDYNIILDKTKDIYISDKIITKAHCYNLNNIYSLEKTKDLYYNEIYETKYLEREDILRDYKSAEFLSYGVVELKYLKAVVFKTKESCYKFKENYPDWNINVLYDRNLF